MNGPYTESDGEEEEEEMEVRFSQWGATDRTDLIKQVLPVSEFVDLLVAKLDALTTHSFIAKTQGEYVRKLKETLKEGEFVVLGDFAENHCFIVQVITSFIKRKTCCLRGQKICHSIQSNSFFSKGNINYFFNFKHKLLAFVHNEGEGGRGPNLTLHFYIILLY